jgi:iduronate 2-sulfatase
MLKPVSLLVLPILMGGCLVLLLLVSSLDPSHAHSSATAPIAPQKTNLLYIMYDDLRPELSIYGNPHMITPNFERLAKRSVTFDYAFCQVSSIQSCGSLSPHSWLSLSSVSVSVSSFPQIAVCNPSRDSLMTGLRPDTVGTYGFQYSFRPNVVFPAILSHAGYKTASYGKILHWDGPDQAIWNTDQWDGDWYGYQAQEVGRMNSSTMPDKVKREEDFRDYMFTTRAIDMMKRQHEEGNLFMVSVGFKLPHLAVHIPHKYFQWYQNYSARGIWKRPKRELRFPPSSPIVAHKCCALPIFTHMEEEGAVRSGRHSEIGNIHKGFSQQVYNELMVGYAAAVSFLDVQIGRLLDTIDELNMWDNITIVLTSDHGMHNGEKGIW